MTMINCNLFHLLYGGGVITLQVTSRTYGVCITFQINPKLISQ